MGDEIAKRMHWLMGQVICDKNPITPEEILRFGTNPNVILPENAVELIKVADNLPQLKPRWHRNIPGGLLLDKNGPIALVYDLSKKEVNLYRCNNAVQGLGKFEDYASLTHEAEIKILAMVDNQPLWVTTSRYLYGEKKEVTWKLHLGFEELASLFDVSHICFEAANKLLVYSNKRKECHVIKLLGAGRGALVEECKLPVDDGRQLTFMTKVFNKIWLGTEDHIIVGKVWLKGQGKPIALYNNGVGGQVAVCVEKGKSSLFVGDVDQGDGHSSGYFYYNRDKRQNPISIGDLAYSHGINKLPNDFWAYVGIARHQQRCWVVNGVPCEAWNWVSEIFQHPNHGLCYWGMTPTHLILMKL